MKVPTKNFCLIQDVENWMLDYKLNQDLHIDQEFRRLFEGTRMRHLNNNVERKSKQKKVYVMGMPSSAFTKDTFTEETASIKYLKNTEINHKNMDQKDREQ